MGAPPGRLVHSGRTLRPGGHRALPGEEARMRFVRGRRIAALVAAVVALTLVRSASAADPTWESRASFPPVPGSPGAVGYGGIIYLTGGTTLEAYDPAVDAWSARESTSIDREDFGFAELNGLLYATGGVNTSGTKLTAVEAYDPVTDTWSGRAALPVTRRQHASAAAAGRVYVIGGFNSSNQWLSTVHVYDPVS